jgi:hypothetical protein
MDIPTMLKRINANKNINASEQQARKKSYFIAKTRAKKNAKEDEFHAEWLAKYPQYAPEAPKAVPKEPKVAPAPPEGPKAAPAAKPVAVARTLEQGDCFYSALYRAASERGLLGEFKRCLLLPIDSEDEFVKHFRFKLARRIMRGELLKGMNKGGELDTYDMLVFRTSDGSYKATMAHMPAWFVREFGRSGELLGTRESFLKRFAAGVATLTNWVSEIEVQMVADMMKACSIAFRVHTKKEKMLFEKESDKDMLHLYNPRAGHYEFFSFTAGASSAGKAEDLKAAIAECKAKCAEMEKQLKALKKGGGRKTQKRRRGSRKRL